jgi:hypothetical protein
MSQQATFHELVDRGRVSDHKLSSVVQQLDRGTIVTRRQLSYLFTSHFHPYVASLVDRLIEGSVTALQGADTEYQSAADGTPVLLADGKPRPTLYADLFSPTAYAPTALVAKPYPLDDLDFQSNGAYAVYNWELFYHLPMTIAIHLSRNQRFEEARQWFHYVFDPTDDSSGPTPQRYWKVKPFQTTDLELISTVLVNLSTGADPALRDETINAIGAWQDNPFRPFLVARYRQTAFMFKAVMAYLDNLIDWGDSLFRQDTGEAIAEASQLYVMAANILGRRPQAVPRKGYEQPQTYQSLRGKLDAFGNAMVDIEADIPFNLAPHPVGADDDPRMSMIQGLGQTLYFCVPRNDMLLGYWDRVADRLFKIRNSLNIEGVFRQLPLFDPPIDPALLAKAAASGLDISAVVGGLNQPLPLVRYASLSAKASELCQQVNALGAALLGAIEKQDNEALAILRAQHETDTLTRAESTKYAAYQDAVKAREGLAQSLANAAARHAYYERQLGNTAPTVPDLPDFDADSLASLAFRSTEPTVALRDLSIDIASDLGTSGGKIISSYEKSELGGLSDAHGQTQNATQLTTIGAALNVIPNVSVDGKPLGVGGGVSIGGSNFGSMMSALASAARGTGDDMTYGANRSAKIGGYDRRQLEWAYQSNLVAGEITATYKQLRAAQIREAMSQQEWHNHQQQIKQAQAISDFLTDDRTGKTTNHDFYVWLRREVRALYSQTYDLAYAAAKKAERALQHELGDPTLTFLQPSYLGGPQGLLAGEKLGLDLQRMHQTYLDQNRREYELTKHVSLRQLDPAALLSLRTTGTCSFTVPEEAFDLDTPGHYFRRLKSVALSIPCVAGPYTSVNATLTLNRSSIRTSSLLSDNGYPRSGDDQTRFSDFYGRVESIVTSTGAADTGLFETNLRDERYLPFEGSGAIGQWQIRLPHELPQFDFGTITDVVLHLRYTAREGGEPLRGAAVDNLRTQLTAAAGIGSTRMLSLRQEFPTEWARFTAATISGAAPVAPLSFTLRPEHYPFWATAFTTINLSAIMLYAEPAAATKPTVTVYDQAVDDPAHPRKHDPLVTNSALGNLRTGAISAPLPPAVGPISMYLDDNSMNDIWIALTWGA